MKKIIYTFIISGLSIAATHTAHAQTGSLDNSFGIGGKETTSLGICDDVGFSIALQSDGKIVVAGTSANCLDYYNPDFEFALVRYNTNGSLDSTFDTDGKLTTDFGIDSNDEAYSVAIQSDGKIVAAGTSFNGSNYDFALARYNSDGSLDGTFGSGGKVITAIGDSDDMGSSVAIQSDGKIIVAGRTHNGTDYDFALVRYNTDGTLDNTFSTDGKVTTAIGPFDDVGLSAAIQSDGKIVVSGYSDNSNNSDFVVARYNTDGSLDNTFSADGKTTTGFGNTTDFGNAVTIQSDGRIVVVGPTFDGVNEDFAIARYNTDGNLDHTFDVDGKLTTSLSNGYDYPTSVTIQSDGKLVVAGWGTNQAHSNFAIARYNGNGSLDTTFDNDGKVLTDFDYSQDRANSVAIQSDGKIVLAGYSFNSKVDFAIARYNGDSTFNTVESIADVNTISVSPNPFTTAFVVQGTAPAGELMLFDFLGKEILEQQTFSSLTKINTEKLVPGIYLLDYSFGNKTLSEKVIKF